MPTRASNSAIVKYGGVCVCVCVCVCSRERLGAFFVSVICVTSLKVNGANRKDKRLSLSVLKEEVNRKVSLQTRGIHFSLARTYFHLVVCDCLCQRTNKLLLICSWVTCCSVSDRWKNINTVIPRLTKIIRSGIIFVSRNLRKPKRDFS